MISIIYIPRLQSIAAQCVHTWYQKVYSVYFGIEEDVRKKLVLLHGQKFKEYKSKYSTLIFVLLVLDMGSMVS